LFGLFFATLVTLVFLPSVLVEVLNWRSRLTSKGAETPAGRI
jgi:hypothetical protein